MCDIFPEVSACCFCISLRIGMLLISVIAIMTAVISLGTVAQKTKLNYHDIYNIKNIKNTGDAMDKSSTLVSTGISAFSCAFMFTGLMLLFGTLFDSEGLIQVFVWITFLNVITGFGMVIAIAVECLVKVSCILSDLDWLSASTVLVLTLAYLFVWIYFISVANSYVVAVK
ncbi:uncharacterized protein [Maniola hyperantus]|uniref:uncharacterized protein n=1 Tax=Aphantopus hyperantus TaxID=2795564 RepID=UPI00156975ED|nr:uncharacterized protein LOC117993403 [Maniola hyperantus]